MRRLRYAVASSLDGFIAGPRGEADWIIMDPDLDFEAIWGEFDTLLIGRRTFEGMGKAGRGSMPGVESIVFSRTLDPADYPDIRIVSDGAADFVTDLKAQAGKDIWLFGGGLLFRSLLELGLVDTVEVYVIPVLLGGGISLLPSPALHHPLNLTNHRVYEETGTVALVYSIGELAA